MNSKACFYRVGAVAFLVLLLWAILVCLAGSPDWGLGVHSDEAKARTLIAVGLAIATAITVVCGGFMGAAGAAAGLSVDWKQSLENVGVTVSPESAKAIFNWALTGAVITLNWIFAYALMYYWRLLPWQVHVAAVEHLTAIADKTSVRIITPTTGTTIDMNKDGFASVQMLFECSIKADKPDNNVWIIKERKDWWFPALESRIKPHGNSWSFDLKFFSKGSVTVHVVQVNDSGRKLLEFFRDMAGVIDRHEKWLDSHQLDSWLTNKGEKDETIRNRKLRRHIDKPMPDDFQLLDKVLVVIEPWREP